MLTCHRGNLCRTDSTFALFAIGNSDCSRERAKTFGVENRD